MVATSTLVVASIHTTIATTVVAAAAATFAIQVRVIDRRLSGARQGTIVAHLRAGTFTACAHGAHCATARASACAGGDTAARVAVRSDRAACACAFGGRALLHLGRGCACLRLRRNRHTARLVAAAHAALCRTCCRGRPLAGAAAHLRLTLAGTAAHLGLALTARAATLARARHRLAALASA